MNNCSHYSHISICCNLLLRSIRLSCDHTPYTSNTAAVNSSLRAVAQILWRSIMFLDQNPKYLFKTVILSLRKTPLILFGFTLSLGCSVRNLTAVGLMAIECILGGEKEEKCDLSCMHRHIIYTRGHSQVLNAEAFLFGVKRNNLFHVQPLLVAFYKTSLLYKSTFISPQLSFFPSQYSFHLNVSFFYSSTFHLLSRV